MHNIHPRVIDALDAAKASAHARLELMRYLPEYNICPTADSGPLSLAVRIASCTGSGRWPELAAYLSSRVCVAGGGVRTTLPVIEGDEALVIAHYCAPSFYSTNAPAESCWTRRTARGAWSGVPSVERPSVSRGRVGDEVWCTGDVESKGRTYRAIRLTYPGNKLAAFWFTKPGDLHGAVLIRAQDEPIGPLSWSYRSSRDLRPWQIFEAWQILRAAGVHIID